MKTQTGRTADAGPYRHHHDADGEGVLMPRYRLEWWVGHVRRQCWTEQPNRQAARGYWEGFRAHPQRRHVRLYTASGRQVAGPEHRGLVARDPVPTLELG
jgi:hypothetical protein